MLNGSNPYKQRPAGDESRPDILPIMTKISGMVRLVVAAAMVPVMMVQPSFGWGGDGHKMINRLAGAALPTDVPEFLRSPQGLNALEYYGPEPDRWRDRTEPELNAAQSPEHFIDLEYADVLGATLPRRRYEFIRALAFAQKDHPDLGLTPEKVGLQPYVTTEVWERLKVGMRQYRTLLAAKQDTKPVEAEVLFYAGWLGHYVADGSMPLHTSIQYNGWTGPNPNNYTTEHKIHALFEGDSEVVPLIPAKPVLLGDVFDDYMKYLRHSNSLVEKTYQIEKTGGFAGAGTPEGKAFLNQQLAAGATELRDMIYTAWVRSADPVPPYKP